MSPQIDPSSSSHDASAQAAAGESKGRVAFELLVIIATFLIIKGVAAQFTDFSVGPIAALIALTIAHFFLKRRGISWFDLGLARPASWLKTLAWAALIILVFMLAVAPLLGLVIFPALGLESPDISRFADLAGNLGLLLLWILLSFAVGGFVEEMLVRGFVLNRFRDLFGNIAYALPLAIVAQAALFGLAHSYQGFSGIIATGLAGLVMGIFYVVVKRSLWPLILAHGTVDSIGFIAIYFGAVPV